MRPIWEVNRWDWYHWDVWSSNCLNQSFESYESWWVIWVIWYDWDAKLTVDTDMTETVSLRHLGLNLHGYGWDVQTNLFFLVDLTNLRLRHDEKQRWKFWDVSVISVSGVSRVSRKLVSPWRNDQNHFLASGTNHTWEAFAYLKCLFLKNYGGKKIFNKCYLDVKKPNKYLYSINGSKSKNLTIFILQIICK